VADKGPYVAVRVDTETSVVISVVSIRVVDGATGVAKLVLAIREDEGLSDVLQGYLVI
jgi:hypothetical protein